MPTAHAAKALRGAFIGWQCHIRKRAARNDDGRPSPGMRPRFLDAAGGELAAAVTILTNEADPRDSTLFFRHQFLRTLDAAERRSRALEALAADHFQDPSLFSDVMTALFGARSALPGRLLGEARCVLEFAENDRRYRLPCSVGELALEAAFYQATYWHNHLFNPHLPPEIRILSFVPDWVHASGG